MGKLYGSHTTLVNAWKEGIVLFHGRANQCSHIIQTVVNFLRRKKFKISKICGIILRLHSVKSNSARMELIVVNKLGFCGRYFQTLGGISLPHFTYIIVQLYQFNLSG